MSLVAKLPHLFYDIFPFPMRKRILLLYENLLKIPAFATLVDSVIITKNNSNYQKSNDTLDIINNATGGDYPLNIDYDYEIYLPTTNKIFKISNITQQQTYFRSVPYYKRECVNPIKSYLLNEQITNGYGGIIFLHN